jgi:hypothetical protein
MSQTPHGDDRKRFFAVARLCAQQQKSFWRAPIGRNTLSSSLGKHSAESTCLIKHYLCVFVRTNRWSTIVDR